MKPYYDDGRGIVIYHGRCEEIIPALPKVDLVCTDPPYGIGEARGKNKSRTKAAVARDYGVSNWDDAPPAKETIELVISSGRHAILFGGNFFHVPPSRCWLVWDKDNTGDFADCELAWTNLNKAVRKIKYRWNGMLQQKTGANKEARFHPTQKPLDVMTWAIMQAPEDCKTILDPFMGSGTTLVSAKYLGRQATGIEAEEKYCEIAATRLQQEVLGLC